MNEISYGRQSWRDDSDIIFVPSLINQNYPVAWWNNQMSNDWYVSIPSYCEYCIDCDVETLSMKDSKQGQKKKWLPAGKKADKSDPELQNLSNSYINLKINLSDVFLGKKKYPSSNARVI